MNHKATLTKAKTNESDKKMSKNKKGRLPLETSDLIIWIASSDLPQIIKILSSVDKVSPSVVIETLNSCLIRKELYIASSFSEGKKL